MPVVRRRRQKQPVLEAMRHVADGLGEVAVDGIAGAAGRSGVVRFVQNQQGAGAELAQHVAQAAAVRLVGEQAVGDDEAGAGGPRIDAEPPHPTQVRQPLPVDDLEGQAELCLDLVLPLQGHRRRGGDEDEVDPPAEKKLPQYQPGLDGLAQADVVGDEQVYTRQPQGLVERGELVSVEADAGAERRLVQGAVGGGGRAPLQRAEKGGEDLGVVRPVSGNLRPGIIVNRARPDLRVPDDAELLALRVVVDAGEGKNG